MTGTVVSCVKKNSSFRLVLKDVNVDGKEEKGLLNAYIPHSYTDGIYIADIVVIQGELRTETEYYEEYFRASAINDGLRFSMDGVTA